MTISDRWLLPEGVEDILPPQAWQIEALRRQLLDTYQRWGYQLIMPPLIEYLDSLLTGTGNDLALQTFKLTDQLSGRLMGVRADMTPQAARIDAHLLRESCVTRLCYAGHVLHARPAHLLASRTPLQTGCELFGSSAPQADQEIIALMLDLLLDLGIGKIHLDLAHVGIFKQLIAAANLDAAHEAAIFDAMGRKSIPELTALLGDAAPATPGGILLQLAALGGGMDVLPRVRALLVDAPTAVSAALAEMVDVAIRVAEDFPQVELGFDFCELRGYKYHTGLVFAAYTPGQGVALAQGGRYDAVGRDFGRARPATGFSADLRLLAGLASGAKASHQQAIWAPAETACASGKVSGDAGPDALALRQTIRELRKSHRVEQALPDESPAQQMLRQQSCDRVLSWQQGQWRVLEKM